MFSKDEILARLRDGADASDIAQQMADNINAALDEYKAEQDAAKRDEVRRNDARAMVKLMGEFFSKYMGEDELADEDVEKSVDAVLELVDSMHELREALNAAVAKPDRKPSGHSASDDDTIRRFLNTL